MAAESTLLLSDVVVPETVPLIGELKDYDPLLDVIAEQ
jgi:hypothetical protein